MGRLTRATVVIALLVGSLAIGGCAYFRHAGELTGVEWALVGSSMNSVDLGAAGITARFADGRMTGFSGVNQYGGPYVADKGGAFEAGPFNTTLMAGPEPLMKAESAYLKLLQGCDTYSVVDGKLRLFTKGVDTLLYEPAKPVKLSGTSWTVTGYNNGKQAVQSVSADATLTMEFSAAGKLSGNSGVNSYSGPYEVSGPAVKIGPLSATLMAGSEELMTQESQFLAALQNATVWSIQQGRLELRDGAGAVQVTGVPVQ